MDYSRRVSPGFTGWWPRPQAAARGPLEPLRKESPVRGDYGPRARAVGVTSSSRSSQESDLNFLLMPSVSIHDSKRATQATLRLVVLLSAALTLVFFLSFFFSDRGIAELQSARTHVAALRAGIARLEAENTRLKGEIESVRQSTYAVEKIAREDLGMSRKGEVVYMLQRR